MRTRCVFQVHSVPSASLGARSRTGVGLNHVLCPAVLEAYSPGTGATVITSAVPPGRGLPIALRWADPCFRTQALHYLDIPLHSLKVMERLNNRMTSQLGFNTGARSKHPYSI